MVFICWYILHSGPFVVRWWFLILIHSVTFILFTEGDVLLIPLFILQFYLPFGVPIHSPPIHSIRWFPIPTYRCDSITYHHRSGDTTIQIHRSRCYDFDAIHSTTVFDTVLFDHYDWLPPFYPAMRWVGRYTPFTVVLPIRSVLHSPSFLHSVDHFLWSFLVPFYYHSTFYYQFITTILNPFDHSFIRYSDILIHCLLFHSTPIPLQLLHTILLTIPFDSFLIYVHSFHCILPFRVRWSILFPFGDYHWPIPLIVLFHFPPFIHSMNTFHSTDSPFVPLIHSVVVCVAHFYRYLLHGTFVVLRSPFHSFWYIPSL